MTTEQVLDCWMLLRLYRDASRLECREDLEPEERKLLSLEDWAEAGAEAERARRDLDGLFDRSLGELERRMRGEPPTSRPAKGGG